MIYTATLPAFFASFVEFVEALTIVLAVGVTRGWRSAWLGTIAGVVLLTLLVALLGPALRLVPLHALQLVVGVLCCSSGCAGCERRSYVMAARSLFTTKANSTLSIPLRSPARPTAGSVDRTGVLVAFNGGRARRARGRLHRYRRRRIERRARSSRARRSGGRRDRDRGRSRVTPAARERSGKRSEVCGRRHVVGIRNVLERAKAWGSRGPETIWRCSLSSWATPSLRCSVCVVVRRNAARARNGCGREGAAAARVKKLLGLFVDDWAFAAAIALWVALVAFAARLRGEAKPAGSDRCCSRDFPPCFSQASSALRRSARNERICP